MRRVIQAFWEENALRWALFLPLAYALGAAYYMTSRDEPSWGVLLGSVVAGVVSMRLLHSRWSWIGAAGAVVLMLGAGGLAAKIRAIVVKAPVLIEETDISVVEGVLVGIEHGENGNRLVIRASAISNLSSADTPVYVRVTQKKTTQIGPGRPIRCLAKLGPPPFSGAPGDYDFRRQAYFRKLGGVGFVLGSCEPMAYDLTRRGVMGAVQDWISAFRRKAALHIADSAGPLAGGMAAAMATGDRSLMTNEHVEALRAAGLAHLLAISGLHMSLAGGVFYFGAHRLTVLIEPLALRAPPARVAAVFALAACTFYLVLSGGGVATQRAYVMAGTAFAAKIMDRSALSLRNLASAMFIVITLQPETVVSPGFQMSFSAAGALVAVYEVQKHWFRGGHAANIVLRFIVGAFVASFTASLATAPFAAFHFNRFAALSIPANMAAAPIISFWAAPSAALAGVAAPFGFDGVFLRSFGIALEWVLNIAAFMSGGEKSTMSPMGGGAFIAASASVALFIILRGVGRWLFLAPMILGALLWKAEVEPVIIIDKNFVLYAQGSSGWVRLTTRAGAKSVLPPLQIDSKIQDVDCGGSICSLSLKKEGWRLELTQPGDEQDAELHLFHEDAPSPIWSAPLYRLASTRIGMTSADVKVEQRLTSKLAPRPWRSD